MANDLEVIQTVVKKGIEESHGGLVTAIYACIGVIGAGVGGIATIFRRLSTKLNKAHEIHVALLKGQVDQLTVRVVSLETLLSGSQRDNAAQSAAYLEQLTAALTTSAESSSRSERANQAVADTMRLIHNDLRCVQEKVLQLWARQPGAGG